MIFHVPQSYCVPERLPLSPSSPRPHCGSAPGTPGECTGPHTTRARLVPVARHWLLSDRPHPAGDRLTDWLISLWLEYIIILYLLQVLPRPSQLSVYHDYSCTIIPTDLLHCDGVGALVSVYVVCRVQRQLQEDPVHRGVKVQLLYGC